MVWQKHTIQLLNYWKKEHKNGKDTKDSRMKDDEDNYNIEYDFENDEHKPNGN